MKEDDARNRDHATLEAIRIRAPELVEGAKRAGWRKPGCCAIPEDRPACDAGMARLVPAGWLGRLESAPSVQKAAEARRQEAAMGLRYAVALWTRARSFDRRS